MLHQTAQRITPLFSQLSCLPYQRAPASQNKPRQVTTAVFLIYSGRVVNPQNNFVRCSTRRKTITLRCWLVSNPVRPSAQYQISLCIYFETGEQGNPGSKAGSSSTSVRWSECNRGFWNWCHQQHAAPWPSGAAVLLGEMQWVGMRVERGGHLRTWKLTSRKQLAEVKLLRNSNNLDHLNTHLLPAFPFSSFDLLKHWKRVLATGSGIPGNK